MIDGSLTPCPAPRPVLIAGPTASGKSAIALALAERDGGIIINADALQIYRCWRVLTARPGPEDLARAPHALYGHVACDARYSVGHWLRDVEPVLVRAAACGRRAIVTGGTGLYFRALTEGLAPVPAVPPAIRAASDSLLASGRIAALRDDLARGDPETYARIDPSNPRRVQRAWEVLRATGRGLAAWQCAGAPALVPPAAAFRAVVSLNKDPINKMIEERFHSMLEQGAVDEVRAALAAGWEPTRPSARALGARELAAHLKGEMPLDAAAAAAVAASRRFAKRQRTWLRTRMADWTWLDRGRLSQDEVLAAIPRT